MKGLLERGVQKQIHRVKERLFESSKARDVTEHLNNGNLVTNFRVLCVLGISSFSSLKTKLLQVSTKNCNLRPGPIPEVCDSQASCHSAHAQSKVWQVWLAENSKWLLCAYSRKLDPPPQRSQFFMLTKRSATSGDENGHFMGNYGSRGVHAHFIRFISKWSLGIFCWSCLVFLTFSSNILSLVDTVLVNSYEK